LAYAVFPSVLLKAAFHVKITFNKHIIALYSLKYSDDAGKKN
jgi:hypothetical protein